jgi:predicted nuclease of predicted toxin-antitoxin system
VPGKIRFYTDEHVSQAVVRGLRRRGVDVVTAVDAGMLSAPDPEHLARAHAGGRVVFTQDRDFLRLHAEAAQHSGIVYARQGTPVGEIIQGLVLIYEVLDPEEMRDHREFL